MPHLIYIAFLFVLGSCIGSFLNVVVYRLPNGLSLISPPSHCPNCKTPLAFYDNIPVLGWILLKGKCRYCAKPISARYPIIEAITGAMFALYYVLIFVFHAGPVRDVSQVVNSDWFAGEMRDFWGPGTWQIFLLYLALLSALLAASLIDAELYIIPAEIPWIMAVAGIVVHALADGPEVPGNVIVSPVMMAVASGAGIGLLISIFLLYKRVFPLSFPEPDLLEVEREALKKKSTQAKSAGQIVPDEPVDLTPSQTRAEIRKEMLFLMPPLGLACLSAAAFLWIHPVNAMWQHAAEITWLNAGLGALMGGLIGGFMVWFARIAGSYALGKEAMGMGDVHLMFGMGAVLGSGQIAVTFFVAPFCGIVIGIYMLITRSRRQLPYGPYLSFAAAVVMLFYSGIINVIL
jgi:leader peptidase (prepilin peptidase)/N-methyltransferase